MLHSWTDKFIVHWNLFPHIWLGHAVKSENDRSNPIVTTHKCCFSGLNVEPFYLEWHERAVRVQWPRGHYAQRCTTWKLGAQRNTQYLWTLCGEELYKMFENQHVEYFVIYDKIITFNRGTDINNVTIILYSTTCIKCFPSFPLCYFAAKGHCWRSDSAIWWSWKAFCADQSLFCWLSEIWWIHVLLCAH